VTGKQLKLHILCHIKQVVQDADDIEQPVVDFWQFDVVLFCVLFVIKVDQPPLLGGTVVLALMQIFEDDAVAEHQGVIDNAVVDLRADLCELHCEVVLRQLGEQDADLQANATANAFQLEPVVQGHIKLIIACVKVRRHCHLARVRHLFQAAIRQANTRSLRKTVPGRPPLAALSCSSRWPG